MLVVGGLGRGEGAKEGFMMWLIKCFKLITTAKFDSFDVFFCTTEITFQLLQRVKKESVGRRY